MIHNSIRTLIGNTPLLKLNNIIEEEEIPATILAKLELFNPGGSVKDRIAYAMLQEAIAQGKVDGDTIIIEPTSGNTGIGLAAIASSLRLKLILTMPETMSMERRQILKAYGAKIVLTDGKTGMKGAIAKAEELAKEHTNSFIPAQFDNSSNPEIHYNTTGPEIYRDTEGAVDIFVSGVGTGGTVSGVGRYLKEQDPKIQIVAVEPSASPVLSGGEPAPHKIQGIGAGFIPSIYDESVVDEIIQVENEAAFAMSKALAQTEGLLVGTSSGAALAAAKTLANRPENMGKNIVVLFPDTGERYLSTDLFK